ncbi:MAG: DUF433 domain-containing protein [Nanoarchaeota archaeon]
MAEWQSRIDVDPNILVGKPIIRGTRLSVYFILELLAQGWTIDKILRNYPQLKKEDIKAALEYSAHALKLESVYSI